MKPGFFFRLIALPAGALARGTGYVALDVASSAADGSNRVIPVGLEQFDLQSPGAPMIGVEEGWHEPDIRSTDSALLAMDGRESDAVGTACRPRRDA